jgi:hypothetical protein
MTATPAKPGEGEFNRLFKDEFARLFKRPNKNALAIKTALIKMVKFILRGWTFPNAEIMGDVEHDVYKFVFNPDFLAKVDADQNPAAFLRTSINREIDASLPKYLSTHAEVTDDTIPAPIVHDAMSHARNCREEVSHVLQDFVSRVRVCEGMDAEIEYLANQYREAEDYEVMQGIECGIFALQKARKKFTGEYKPLTIGTFRFAADTFIRFAPKEEK